MTYSFSFFLGFFSTLTYSYSFLVTGSKEVEVKDLEAAPVRVLTLDLKQIIVNTETNTKQT